MICAIVQFAIRPRKPQQRLQKAGDKRLALVQELLRDLGFRKHFVGRHVFEAPRLFVLPCLLQVGTLGGAIEGDFPLLAAALRANAPVYGRAEALFLAQIADGTGQIRAPRRTPPKPSNSSIMASLCDRGL